MLGSGFVLKTIFLLTLLVSCSSQKRQTASDKPLMAKAPTINEEKKHQIKGSADLEPTVHHEEGGKKIYFLYGAEHLNLDNYYFDIPVVYNNEVKKWINYFLNRGKDFFIRYSERSGRYAPVMGRILEENGLPRDLIFLAMAESGFHNKAKSWAAAVGPWQFMPYTGKKYGLKIDWYLDERRDPFKSTVAASKYLKDLFALFGSWELAAAGYNAGEGKIGRAIRRYSTQNFWDLSKGRYLKSETKNYVPKIMALAIIGKNLKAFGFEDIEFHPTLNFDEIKVGENTDLYTVAEKLGIEFDTLHYLNPELLRWQTPPNIESYNLRVPVGLAEVFAQCCSESDLKAAEYVEYTFKQGGTLKTVAQKFKIKDFRVLENLNGISGTQQIKKGTVIKLPFHNNQSLKDPMYTDLYEQPHWRTRKRRSYQSAVKEASRRGKLVVDPKQFYVVQKGDTLWDVSKKTGVSLDTLIKSNLKIVHDRMIREGDRLVIR